MSPLIDPYDLIHPRNYGAPHDTWTTLREKAPVCPAAVGNFG